MGHVRSFEQQFRSLPTPPRWHDKGGRKPREARLKWKDKEVEGVKEYNLKVVIRSLNWANGD